MTETCAFSFATHPDFSSLTGGIGFSLDSLQWRLEATALGHDPLGSPPQGQLLVRGPTIFKAYLVDKVRAHLPCSLAAGWWQQREHVGTY